MARQVMVVSYIVQDDGKFVGNSLSLIGIEHLRIFAPGRPLISYRHVIAYDCSRQIMLNGARSGSEQLPSGGSCPRPRTQSQRLAPGKRSRVPRGAQARRLQRHLRIAACPRDFADSPEDVLTERKSVFNQRDSGN